VNNRVESGAERIARLRSRDVDAEMHATSRSLSAPRVRSLRQRTSGRS